MIIYIYKMVADIGIGIVTQMFLFYTWILVCTCVYTPAYS